ncbi:hypothetical protein SmJEL517_g03843 [Synchytrium microbalum]|uniref:AAA+ ATPase domain-containing protein n=1 Tax=Synchytrium microbalum TaxID=1806994 RepID=A0A507BWP9_9FUNG|nr:uncharacterized protein SmJEL517_g03843 [Synchytrium microbalum]TPX33247.1 hypothetical protein SmJEL517_g03843 [Synchytrium microbalum]
MSNRTYNELWAEASEKLVSQADYEKSKEAALAPKDRDSALQHLAILYINYVQIFRSVENAYDQVVHPQKRRLLRDLLLSVTGRLLEVKQKLVELQCSDIQHFPDILIDMKLVPEDLNVAIPRFYVEDRAKDLEARRQLMNSLSAKTFGATEITPLFPAMSVDEAVGLIQKNERGRQGRLRAKHMREIRLQAKREQELDAHDDASVVQNAAIRIQKTWRGFRARKEAAATLHAELEFLKMQPSARGGSSAAKALSEQNRARRKITQTQHEEEYQQALINTKEKLMKVEGPEIRETMQDNFRQWYMDHKKTHGKFPEFPSEDEWNTPGFSFMGPPAVTVGGDGDDQIGKKSRGSSASSKSAAVKKGDKKDAKGKGGDDAADEDPFKLDKSEFLKDISAAQTAYAVKWATKHETDNFAQKHDQETIRVDKRKEVEAEIKQQIYEVLKDELENLKLSVDREKSKAKKGDKKGKGGKKGKEKGGKKGKKEKDLTANRTMEDLIAELVEAGILLRAPELSINDFKGSVSLLSTFATQAPVITPTLSDVKRAVTEFCILPLGLPATVKAPAITSMLLVGAKGTGKTQLTGAIASETGAHIFNISPKHISGLYTGKAATTKMIHMVFKVAKANPPSVIYIDGVEMIFAKKVPKEDTSDPKRLKKDLTKQLKGLEVSDRVLVVGNSTHPWDGDIKALVPCFDKVLLVPLPDYASRGYLWKEYIETQKGVSLANINITLLTRLSEGMSAGDLKLICDRTMTDRRLKLVRHHPLNTNEFIKQLIKLLPINREEDSLMQDWFSKTTLAKKRAAILDDSAAAATDKKGAKK